MHAVTARNRLARRRCTIRSSAKTYTLLLHQSYYCPHCSSLVSFTALPSNVRALSECTGEAHLGHTCVPPASDLPNDGHTHSVPTALLPVRRNAPPRRGQANIHVRSVEAFRNKRLARTRMPPPTITPGPSKPCMGQGQTGSQTRRTSTLGLTSVCPNHSFSRLPPSSSPCQQFSPPAPRPRSVSLHPTTIPPTAKL